MKRFRARKVLALQVELCLPRLIASRAEARQRLIRAFGRGSGRRASQASVLLSARRVRGQRPDVRLAALIWTKRTTGIEPATLSLGSP